MAYAGSIGVSSQVFDVLGRQGRSALLPHAVISAILSQLAFNVTYEPLPCENVALNLARDMPGADVLLDGDSAFAASAVSDLRTLPEHARTLAKQLKAQIEAIFDSGRMNVQSEF
ncbi:hypothetical protein KIN20_031847 [Parelaphostrongylus tenuis]|uniref:Uncharacterized protein n=1 Tax=Parelaphostrongylus tenuis TaxID=148309 RepID=A0AAD5WHA6_PARTN|nr:hypothetical protein KIN20_031847 [Parelaphostrongylus tenuis]